MKKYIILEKNKEQILKQINVIEMKFIMNTTLKKDSFQLEKVSV